MPKSSVRGLADLFWVLVRYYSVAAVVAAVYLGLYALLLAIGVHYYVAIVITQAITIIWAFPVYRRFVFRSRGALGADFLRFITVWGGGMVAGFLLTPLLVEVFGVDPFWAQLATMVLVSVLSFVFHRLFTFSKKSEPSKSEVAP